VSSAATKQYKATAGLSSRVRTPVYDTDTYYPQAFWLLNQWNDQVGNMAAGVASVGSCFWLAGHLSVIIGDGPSLKLKYDSPSASAAMTLGEASWTPTIKRSLSNQCVSAAYATSMTNGVPFGMCGNAANKDQCMFAPPGSRLTSTTGLGVPLYSNNADFNPLVAADHTCASGISAGCTAVIIERFRTSFNTASDSQFGALWMRGDNTNFIFSGLQITDQLYSGSGIVTGGTPDVVLENVLNFYLDAVAIGQTQWSSAACKTCFASTVTNAACDEDCVSDDESGMFPSSICIAKDQSKHPMSYTQFVVVPPFLAKKTFASIYDGPFYVHGFRALNQPTPVVPYGACYSNTAAAILRKGQLTGRLPMITEQVLTLSPCG